MKVRKELIEKNIVFVGVFGNVGNQRNCVLKNLFRFRCVNLVAQIKNFFELINITVPFVGKAVGKKMIAVKLLYLA